LGRRLGAPRANDRQKMKIPPLHHLWIFPARRTGQLCIGWHEAETMTGVVETPAFASGGVGAKAQAGADSDLDQRGGVGRRDNAVLRGRQRLAVTP
jgi:hypothetical protein